jgi:hypothetical protein
MDKRMNIDREGAKWLNLALETYGLDGVNEMARALGFPITRLETRKRVGVAEKDDTGSDAWREPIRMPAMCPARKPTGDSRWKPYEGFPSVFHCGYDGFLENRRPSRSQPVAECFYDELSQLVDQNHPYAGCRGTPNQYPTDDHRHITEDEGGVAEEGWDSFWESRQRDLDRLFGAGW